MQRFETIAETTLADMLDKRMELTLAISEAAVGFKKHIPRVNFDQPIEVPPTSIIFYDRREFARAIAYSGNDLSGKHQRLVLTVYAFGGQIFYKSIGPGEYEARIVWPAPPPPGTP